MHTPWLPGPGRHFRGVHQSNNNKLWLQKDPDFSGKGFLKPSCVLIVEQLQNMMQLRTYMLGVIAHHMPYLYLLLLTRAFVTLGIPPPIQFEALSKDCLFVTPRIYMQCQALPRLGETHGFLTIGTDFLPTNCSKTEETFFASLLIVYKCVYGAFARLGAAPAKYLGQKRKNIF